MRISASRLAAALAARLNPVVPSPFWVCAESTDLRVDHPTGWGLRMPLAWIEAEGECREAAELVELIGSNALSSLQDSSGLRFLRPDLLFFGLGATRKRHSLAPLAKLTHVQDLWLEGHTKDFEVVSQLHSLQRLSLRSIRLPNLSGLRSLKRLESLELKLGGSTDLRDPPEIGALR
jgi:hypothetical protein